MKKILIGLFSLFMIGSACANEVKDESERVISSLTENVIKELSANKDKIQDNEYLKGVVVDLILPDVDKAKLAQVVLSRVYGELTEKQRVEFEDSFMNLLVGTYASALSTFDDHTYEIKGVQQSKKAPNYVRVSVNLNSSSSKIFIQYSMFKKDGVFKIYDVGVDGVFLTKTFKNSLRSAYAEGGYEKLIAQITQ